WQRVLELGLGIARGLAAAHRQGILHRDVKPANIVLTRAGAPKLIDFGIAKVRGRSDDEDLAATADAGATGRLTAHGDVTLTDEGRLVGTPLYMAPELWQGDRASESCDLYALGLVLYELLCGELPFARLSGAALIAQILSAELPSPLAASRDLPPAFADVIVRLTRHAAGDRYRDADAVVDALEVIRSLYRPLVDAPTEERVVPLEEHLEVVVREADERPAPAIAGAVDHRRHPRADLRRAEGGPLPPRERPQVGRARRPE
ncbi:MAG: serine/threonine protein kinase, partial [Myxococcales bacterium]|nr:serine/threonine protein kinase [Myxococcales bacterium]